MSLLLNYAVYTECEKGHLTDAYNYGSLTSAILFSLEPTHKWNVCSVHIYYYRCVCACVCVCVCVCVCEQNQLKDRSVIQLYSKATGVYLGLRVSGQVVAMTNPDNDASE